MSACCQPLLLAVLICKQSNQLYTSWKRQGCSRDLGCSKTSTKRLLQNLLWVLLSSWTEISIFSSRSKCLANKPSNKKQYYTHCYFHRYGKCFSKRPYNKKGKRINYYKSWRHHLFFLLFFHSFLFKIFQNLFVGKQNNKTKSQKEHCIVVVYRILKNKIRHKAEDQACKKEHKENALVYPS